MDFMKCTFFVILISIPNILPLNRSLMKPSPKAVSLSQQSPCSVGSPNILDCLHPLSPLLSCFSPSGQILIFITPVQTLGNSSELQGNIFLDLHLPSQQKV